MAKQIVLIHGAWLTPRSWENFEQFFAAKGYEVLLPEWPRKAEASRRGAAIRASSPGWASRRSSIITMRSSGNCPSHRPSSATHSADRPHLLMAGEGWEEVAGSVADWLDSVDVPQAARTEAAVS